MLRAGKIARMLLGGRLGLSMWLAWLAIVVACVAVMGSNVGVPLGFTIGKVTYVPMLMAILSGRRPQSKRG